MRGEYTMAPKLQKGRQSLGSGHSFRLLHRVCVPTCQPSGGPLVLAAVLQHAGAPIPALELPPMIHPRPQSGCLSEDGPSLGMS